jgi:hypothetical protein
VGSSAGVKISPTPGFDSRILQLVASRCTKWSIPANFGVANSFTVSELRFWMWLSDQLQALAALLPEKETPVPIKWEEWLD